MFAQSKLETETKYDNVKLSMSQFIDEAGISPEVMPCLFVNGYASFYL
jgi:hypothetical protein